LPGRAAWWTWCFTGVPYTVWAHAGADIYNRRHQTPRALRTILSGARAILTCNRANLAYFERILPPSARARVQLQPHGIDLERFQAIPEVVRAAGPLRVLSVGRLTTAKGFQIAVEACGLLQAEGIAVEYRIAGEGPLRDSLGSLAASTGFNGLVLLGNLAQSDLPAQYRWADLFVAPSVIGPAGARDGLPNVLLEAMACGTACIGSDTVGIPEAIEDGVTGRLVPPGDAQALAGVIAELQRQPGKRAELGAAARKSVARFGREPCMDRVATILADTAARS
jgi:glycosyltransferase involved in cell wall biosynthesis